MKCPLGTVLRELKPFKKDQPGEILVYSVRQGRKHPWFILNGYNLVNRRLFNHSHGGRRLEEEYKIIAQYGREEMLTHKEEQVRILGVILARNPKIKTADLRKEIFKAFRF